MENQNSVKDMITNALKDVRSMLDTDVIVGQQIHIANGITIIPISKLSMGFASGGLDLPSKTQKGVKNFGGGGGTGVSVSPIGFLTVYPEGRVEFIPITPTEVTPLEQITDFINRAPEIIGNIRSAFTGGSEEEDPSNAPETEEAELHFENN